MRPTVLFCLLAFTGSFITLHVQSKVICGKDQYTVTNGSLSYCLNCDTCHRGYGLYPVCEQSVTYPPSNIGCKPCPNGTYSAELDSSPCHSCQQCAKHEIVAAPCTRISNRICNGTCEKGYFFSKKVPHICQQCSYCCFDGKDEEQLECIKQGLNATGRHCSARLDKQCGPHLSSSTAAVTTQTHLPSLTQSPTLLKLTSSTSDLTSPSTTAVTVTNQGSTVTHLPSTHSPPQAKLASSTPHPTNHQAGNHPAVIASGILGGLLLAVLLGFMYKRKKQILWKLKGKRTESTLPNRKPVQGNYSNTGNATQLPQTVVYKKCADRRVQSLQNKGYAAASPSATPEVSPSGTPQQTDDELDELPDVVAVRSKRLLKRQSSKETQNNALKKDGANESLLDPNLQAVDEGFNYKGQGGKGAGQSRPRSHSLDVLRRKFSSSLENDDYQQLGEEDPDELQGNGEFEPKPRSGSVLKELKRKFSLPGKQQDYSPVKIEDPDQDRSRVHLTSYTEPIKTEVEPLHQRQKEGSKVEFKCLVQGNKKVFYQWVKDGTEMPGQNSSSLVLDCVEMRDFGYYVCNVNDANDDCIKSPAAVLDVAPRDGMDYKRLSQIDDKTQKKVEILLTKEIHGLGGWKQIAIKYDMDKVVRESLEGSTDAGKNTIEYVKASNPNLKVYEFCKTLKERDIRRFDIVEELLGHLSVLSSEKTT